MKTTEKPAYLVSISAEDESEIINLIKSGTYSFKSDKAAKVLTNRHSILVDFESMREGDSILFFNDRKIYGRCIVTHVIAKMSKDTKTVGQVNFKNDSLLPVSTCKEGLIGMDMDRVLMVAQDPLRTLRMNFGLSWVKMPPPEAKAIIEALMLHRLDFENTIPLSIEKNPANDKNLTQGKVDLICKSDVSEMLIELALVGEIKEGREFNHEEWDFIHHQVPAGPVKPIAYIDKIDCLCIKYLPGTTTIKKILVIEIKNESASATELRQLMKYVDWIAKEWTNGRYDLIDAHLVAPDFEFNTSKSKKKEPLTQEILEAETTRFFAKNLRPYKAERWNPKNILKKYEIKTSNARLKEISFQSATPPSELFN